LEFEGQRHLHIIGLCASHSYPSRRRSRVERETLTDRDVGAERRI